MPHSMLSSFKANTYTDLSSDNSPLLYFNAVILTWAERLFKGSAFITLRRFLLRLWTIVSRMRRKGVLPCNLIGNLSASTRNGYTSKRVFIPQLHCKLTVTVVNTLIWQEFLHGICILLSESTRYNHVVRTDCIYGIEPTFVFANRDLIDDPETLTRDS